MGQSVANDCSDISLKEAQLLERNDAEIGPTNSLHVSAYYSEYNERFDYDELTSSSRAGSDKD